MLRSKILTIIAERKVILLQKEEELEMQKIKKIKGTKIARNLRKELESQMFIKQYESSNQSPIGVIKWDRTGNIGFNKSEQMKQNYASGFRRRSKEKRLKLKRLDPRQVRNSLALD